MSTSLEFSKTLSSDIRSDRTHYIPVNRSGFALAYISRSSGYSLYFLEESKLLPEQCSQYLRNFLEKIK